MRTDDAKEPAGAAPAETSGAGQGGPTSEAGGGSEASAEEVRSACAHAAERCWGWWRGKVRAVPGAREAERHFLLAQLQLLKGFEALIRAHLERLEPEPEAPRPGRIEIE